MSPFVTAEEKQALFWQEPLLTDLRTRRLAVARREMDRIRLNIDNAREVVERARFAKSVEDFAANLDRLDHYLTDTSNRLNKDQQ